MLQTWQVEPVQHVMPCTPSGTTALPAVEPTALIERGVRRQPRSRRPFVRVRWLSVGMLAALVGFALAFAAPAHAAQEGVVEISSDPYTAAVAPTGQHSTEVEPDTFAFGSTMVSAFQVGRIFNGGASNVGWATTRNGGVSWTHGFLPDTTSAATPAGPFFGASDASVAYDARHQVWIISYLALHESGGGVVDVMESRSTDGGLTWSNPITIAATGTFYDKNWTVCDNNALTSPFYGNCYTEFDNAGQRDLELMATSTDGGLTWGPPTSTADNVHGLGGQPVVQPSGRVVVPFEGVFRPAAIRAFTSDDGGATWNASVVISLRSTHRVAGDIRTSPLPSAEISGDGTVYVVWQDNRFEPGGAANDIVLSTSSDGTTWSAVTRIPLNSVGSGVDHFIPGLAVDHDSSGAGTLLALTYYYYPNAACTADTCQLEVGFSTSLDAGQTWSQPQTLAGPMQLSWLANTSQGVMVGDYISTSFLAGQQRVLDAFAVGFAPSDGTAFDEPTFSALEMMRPGATRVGADPVLFASGLGSTGGDSGTDQAVPAAF